MTYKKLPTRHKYEVVPISKNERWSGVGERWKVTYDGDNWGYFKLKLTAIKFAVESAYVKFRTIGEHSTLKIKGRNGAIQDERTYPRSSDPRRAKG